MLSSFRSLSPTVLLRRTMSSQTSNKTFVHLHNFDLRVHDSPSLHLAHDPSSNISKSVSHFLPVYIFDERQLDLSALPGASPAREPAANAAGKHQEERPGYEPKHTRSAPLSRVGKLHRTSPHRLAFLLQSVYGLRDTYRRSGGDMLIGYGKPEVLIPALVKSLEGGVAGVWAQKEYTLEENRTLDNIAEALPSGIEMKLNDSKTMIPPKHLPFNPARDTPDVYTAFRKKVEGMGLSLGEGMLVEPLQTAQWETKGKEVSEVVVSVGKNGIKLKPFPKVEKLDASSGSGWVEKGSEGDSLEGMYNKLSKPLFDNPPIGGWSSAATPGQFPTTHSNSAVPFPGGEVSALSRLEDYLGHPTPNGWQGGEKAKTYKDTRNGLVGEGFSTKFASLLSLGILSAREAGWRVGELLELVNKDTAKRNNVYCEYPLHHLQLLRQTPLTRLLLLLQGSYLNFFGATTSSSPLSNTLPLSLLRCSILLVSPHRSSCIRRMKGQSLRSGIPRS